MKVRLFLKRKGKSGPHPVYVALFAETSDQTQLIYTKEKCALGDWSKADGAPKQDSADPDLRRLRKELYHRIKRVEADVLQVMRLMEAEGMPVTPYSLKNRYEAIRDGKFVDQRAKDAQDKMNAVTVSSLIDKWIKTGLGHWQPSTQKVVITSIKTFQTYLKISGLQRLERKDLSLDIINDYAIDYLQNKKKLRDSSHAKKMKHLRWFLKWMKFESSLIKEIRLRTIKPAERNIIALTLEELTRLENVDVSDSKEQQRAKDMWLLGAYTGLRISDLKRISRTRIDMNTKRLTMVLQKNRKLVTIPLCDEAFETLKRYNWTAPKIAEQQVNESIKQVAAKGGINESVLFRSKRAGKLEEVEYPKHELLTSHCAGKTFISNAAKRWGLTPVDIAAIVGKDVKTVMGYYLKPDVQDAIDKIERVEAGKRAEAEKYKMEAEARLKMKIV